MTNRTRNILAVVAAAVIAGAGIGVGIAVAPTPTPQVVHAPAKAALACQPDPAAQIAAMAPGSTFYGVGVYCTAGIKDDQVPMVNIIGGTYQDTAVATPTAPLKPIIEIKDGGGTEAQPGTIANVTLQGDDPAKGIHVKAGQVGQEGISIRSSSYIDVTDSSSTNTYGDGMTVFVSATKPVVVPTQIHVSGFTATNVGRDGLSPAAVTDSSFTDYTVAGYVTDSAIDMESDIRGLGDSGGITFTNFVAKGGINIIEPVGVLTFANTTATSRVYVNSIGAQIAYSGSFVCERRAPGACVKVVNGTLTLAPGTTSTYVPGHSKPTMIPYLAIPPGMIFGP